MTRTIVRIGFVIAMCCCWIRTGLGQPTKEYIRINGRVVAIESSAAGDFTVASSPASATVVRNSSTTTTITVAPGTSGFSGNVALSVTSGLPTGVTATFSPATLTVNGASITSTLTLAANATATTGTVVVVVSGTSGSLTRTANLNLTTALPPDFTVGGVSNRTITTNGTTSGGTVTVTPANGFTSAVDLSVSGLPSGVSASFSPAQATSTNWSPAISFTATSGATLGTSTVTITGTNSSMGLTRSTTMQLTVVPEPTFSLTGPSGGSVVAGQSGSFGIGVSATGGFSSRVDFSAIGPTGGSATFSPTFVNGSGSSTMTLNVDAATNPGTQTMTLRGISTSPAITKTLPFTLTVTAAQQTITGASVSPSNAQETTIGAVVSDPTGAAQILSAEFSLSTSTNSNTFNSMTACRYRVNRTGTANVFTMSIGHRDGSGTLVDTKTIGQAGILTNDACAIDMALTTVVEGATTWTVNARLRNQAMSGTHYLRGMTTDSTGPSLAQPYTYLGAVWGVPPPPSATFSNSQGITPPVVYSSFNVSVNFAVSNLGSSGIALKLAQAGDGTLSVSGANPLTGVYTAGNSGEDRDVILRGIICSSTCTANESNRTHEYLYTIRVLSSTSSPPSLNFTNPFTGSTVNPSPLNST